MSNTGPTSDTTFLLKNATFDSAGTHGFNGWAFQHSLDTTDFEQDAPPGAGTQGFKIHSVDFAYQSDNITQSFTNLASGVYEFTLWSHTKYVFPDSIFHPAWISITKKSGGVATMVTDSASGQPYMVSLHYVRYAYPAEYRYGYARSVLRISHRAWEPEYRR